MPFHLTYRLQPVDAVPQLSDYLNDTSVGDTGYDIEGSNDDAGVVCVYTDDLEAAKEWVEGALETYGLSLVKSSHREIGTEEYQAYQDQ